MTVYKTAVIQKKTHPPLARCAAYNIHRVHYDTHHLSGADPGFRRGVSYIQKGGGVRTGISGADPNCCRVLGKSTSTTKLQTAVGGGVR